MTSHIFYEINLFVKKFTNHVFLRVECKNIFRMLTKDVYTNNWIS
jgi:hypothetical protein